MGLGFRLQGLGCEELSFLSVILIGENLCWLAGSFRTLLFFSFRVQGLGC